MKNHKGVKIDDGNKLKEEYEGKSVRGHGHDVT